MPIDAGSGAAASAQNVQQAQRARLQRPGNSENLPQAKQVEQSASQNQRASLKAAGIGQNVDQVA
ncbi:MAG: hypothetical protein ABEJ65_10860 [bacterium]